MISKACRKVSKATIFTE